jgi:uncharacterized protein (UPF0332 family)
MTVEQEALLRKAHDSLRAARLLAADGLVDFAASRAYHTMFYVAQAFLLGQGLTFSKHGSVTAAFGQHFVKTGVIPAHLHQYLIRGHNMRVAADYDIKSGITPTQTGAMIKQAEEFIDLAECLIGPLPPAASPP